MNMRPPAILFAMFLIPTAAAGLVADTQAGPLATDGGEGVVGTFEGTKPYDAYATARGVVCKNGWEGASSDNNVVFCQNFHGQIGWATVRLCDPSSALYPQGPVRDQRLDEQIPACWSQYSINNATSNALNRTQRTTGPMGNLMRTLFADIHADGASGSEGQRTATRRAPMNAEACALEADTACDQRMPFAPRAHRWT